MLWIDFVNSEARDPLGQAAPKDRLDDTAWMRTFAETWNLRPTGKLDAGDRRRLKVLRTLLGGLARKLSRGERLAAGEIEAVNRYLAAQPVRPRLQSFGDTFRLEIAPAAKGVQTWLFVIAESFARFLATEGPRRLKTCGNADCEWVFYDATRSRTKRWCAASCGDLIKVRAFRARQRTDKA